MDPLKPHPVKNAQVLFVGLYSPNELDIYPVQIRDFWGLNQLRCRFEKSYSAWVGDCGCLPDGLLKTMLCFLVSPVWMSIAHDTHSDTEG